MGAPSLESFCVELADKYDELRKTGHLELMSGNVAFGLLEDDFEELKRILNVTWEIKSS